MDKKTQEKSALGKSQDYVFGQGVLIWRPRQPNQGTPALVARLACIRSKPSSIRVGLGKRRLSPASAKRSDKVGVPDGIHEGDDIDAVGKRIGSVAGVDHAQMIEIEVLQGDAH